MKPLLLKFSAFGPYAAEETLDFGDLRGRTFFLIHGPTGAGKTTILDAICFALYGDSSGSLRDGRTMRSDHAGAGVLTEVEFSFAVGEAVYRVWRSPEQRRAKKRGEGLTLSAADAVLREVKAGGGETIIAHGYSKVTEKIEALLGFKSSQFRQVVLLPQGEFRKLLLANSAERQEIMQTLFKTELYQRIEENLKREAKEVERQRTALAQQNEFMLKELGAASLEELEASLAAQKAEEKERGAEVKLLGEAQQAAQKAAVEGKLTAGKFEAAQKAARDLSECESRLPEVESFRRKYLDAERAAQLGDVERQLRALEKDVADCAAAEEKQAEEAAKLADSARTAEAALAAERDKQPEREAAEREVLRLAEFAQKRTAIDEARRAAEEREKAAKRCRKESEDGETSLLACKDKLGKRQAALQTLTAEAARLAGYRAELDRLKQRQEKLEDAARIAGELGKVEVSLREAREALRETVGAHEAQRKKALRLQHLFTEGQAAILAKSLTAGAPCPVCGSLSHPRPALSAALLPSEAEVKAAQAELSALEQKRREAEQRLAQLQTRRDTLKSRKDDSGAADFAETPKDIKAQRALAAAKLDAAVKAEAALSAAEAEIAALLAEASALEARQEGLRQARQAAEAAWKAAEAIAVERGASLPEAYRDPAKLISARKAAEEARENLRKRLESAQAFAEKIKREQAAAAAGLRAIGENLRKAKARCLAGRSAFAERLRSAGFEDAATYEAAKRSPAFLQTLAGRIKEFDDRFIAAKDAARKAAREIAALTPPDLARLEARAKESAAAYNQAYADHAQLAERIARREEKRRQLQSLAKKLAKADAAYGVIGTLAEVANGKNAHGLTFQRFVLQSLLEDVIDASNMRLKLMSRGQYALQSTDARARKNAAGGLELEVFDHYTGCARPVATLSGGETFLASLSLALGLADVVQSYAGGIRLDTILVDEGFGTLDPESLDIAIKALIDLQKGGRLVGVISHVPELKERIDARLEVTKGKRGSAARFRVG